MFRGLRFAVIRSNRIGPTQLRVLEKNIKEHGGHCTIFPSTSAPQKKKERFDPQCADVLISELPYPQLLQTLNMKNAELPPSLRLHTLSWMTQSLCQGAPCSHTAATIKKSSETPPPPSGVHAQHEPLHFVAMSESASDPASRPSTLSIATPPTPPGFSLSQGQPRAATTPEASSLSTTPEPLAPSSSSSFGGASSRHTQLPRTPPPATTTQLQMHDHPPRHHRPLRRAARDTNDSSGSDDDDDDDDYDNDTDDSDFKPSISRTRITITDDDNNNNNNNHNNTSSATRSAVKRCRVESVPPAHDPHLQPQLRPLAGTPPRAHLASRMRRSPNNSSATRDSDQSGSSTSASRSPLPGDDDGDGGDGIVEVLEMGRRPNWSQTPLPPSHIYPRQQPSRKRTRSEMRRRVGDDDNATDRDANSSDDMFSDDGSHSPPDGSGAPQPAAPVKFNFQPHFIDRKRHAFVCQAVDKKNFNEELVKFLHDMEKTYESSGDSWRTYAYRKAATALRNLRFRVTSRADVANVPGIGKKMADKIEEILKTGKLNKLEAMQADPHFQCVALFTSCWGIGTKTAELLYAQGCRTLDDIKASPLLQPRQLVGIKYRLEFKERIPREEVSRIEQTVVAEALRLREGLEINAVGSYRRGRATCGDVDIIITHPDGRSHVGLLGPLVERLHQIGLLTDDLNLSCSMTKKTGEVDTYMGVCLIDEIHRRIDIKVYPTKDYPFALLYFTGSAYFNRSMRYFCNKKGLSLSDHGLFPVVRNRDREKIAQGQSIECRTERDIFTVLGLDYKSPSERDIG